MNLDYVNFRRGCNCDTEIVSLDQWNDVLNETKTNYRKAEFENYNVLRIAKYAGTYDVYEGKSYMELRIISFEHCKRIRAYFNGSAEQHRIQHDNAGMEAIMEVQDLARKFGDGKYRSFKRVFSWGKSNPTKAEKEAIRKAYHEIKKCVISPFDYACDGLVGKEIIVNKADVSSAYGSTMQGKLPTLNGHLRISGRVPPNAEYPFAYYIRSHHSAVYGEYDTKEFLNTRFYGHLVYGHKWVPIDTPDEYEETILCKAEEKFSNCFRKAFATMYNMRKEDPEYKFYINACIGMLHLNNDPNCSHLAAVVYGRCVSSMLKRCKAIEEAGGVIALVNTDSISWNGPIPEGLCETGKYLGAFVLEETDIPMIVKSVKCYQYLGHNGLVTRFAGVKKEIAEAMQFGDIMKTEEDGTTFIKKKQDGSLEVKKHG